jgi:Cytochrome C oxidase, cbb3-type, subunit III
VPRGDIAKGLYPKPADLSQSARLYTSSELLWIVKNGIKMSGMPAWADHSDEELWGTVAFIEKLPGMSEADYARLVMESMKQGGRHSHSGGDDEKHRAMAGMDHSAMPGMPLIPASDIHKH